MATKLAHFTDQQEQPAYFEVPGAHLYTVLHQATEPMARILLVGPFATERNASYIPWVQWARYLAKRGVEVLRFDYRGIGESEGVFEEMSFSDWSEDVQLLADWLRRRSPDVPLVLHGLEIGALLAAKAFETGTGDLLLLWSPPATANETLRSALLRWLAVEQISNHSGGRKPASAFIGDFQQGASLEVAGYEWSSRLWLDSFKLDLPLAMRKEATAQSTYGRPVRLVSLGKEASPLVKASYLFDEVPKDLTWLFVDNWEWLATSLRRPRRGNE